MRRVLLIMTMAVLVGAGTAYAQGSAIIDNGPHDLSSGTARSNSDASIAGQTCVFCHTPHGGATAIPLWNRSTPTPAGGYQMYASSTSDVTTTSGSIASSVSGACLSCHDGSIALDVLTNLNGAAKAANTTFAAGSGTSIATYGNDGGGSGNIMTGGLAFLGTNLQNDHPVNITYDTARTAQTPSEFVLQVGSGSVITVDGGSTGALPLYGISEAAATVECATCHNPHNNTVGYFLRKANTNSQICLTCHIK